MISYTRDDIGFLDKIQKDIHASENLLALNVTSRYTNIDNELGAEAITHWVSKYLSLYQEIYQKSLS